MGIRNFIPAWSVVRQLRSSDKLGLGEAAQSSLQAQLKPRTAEADKVAKSICPYCGIGCGQRVYVKDGEITQIEGDPDSPISRGRLCPKGAASRQLVQSPMREYKVRYRPAGAVGTVTLNAVTHGDMVVRGRPASSVPAQVVGKLAERVGIDLSAEGSDGETAQNRRSGLGALSGYAVGLGVGTAYGLVRPLLGDVSKLRAGVVLGLAAMPAATFRPPRWA